MKDKKIQNSKFKNKEFYNFKFLILNSRRAGFTLLELLIAIMILSVITVIIGSGFRLGIKAWEKGEAEAYETQRLRVISGLMSQQLKSVYPYKMIIDEKNVTVFQGKSDSLIFVTTLTSEGGLKWVRYSFKDRNLLFEDGVLPDKKFLEKTEGTSEDEEVIDRNIGEFKFEYFSSEDKEWKESWDLSESIPKAVRVKLAYFHPFLITIPLRIKDDDTKKS